MKNIEVELKSFIPESKYEELIVFLRTHGEFLGEDYQETHYYNTNSDLRMQRNSAGCKVVLKQGQVHDQMREEFEIHMPQEYFDQFQHLFRKLGHFVDIKWFRKRQTFKWKDIDVCLDYTVGYGHIIELEKMASEENKDEILADLKSKLAELNIPLTPRDVFEERYTYYKENWRNLVP